MSPKELKAMKAFAIDFFIKDIEALKNFIKKMKEDFGQNDFLFVLKMFVISSNKVFNMAEYMKNQSKQAEEYVKSKNKNLTAEERRATLNYWIEHNAETYRKNTMVKQIYCIDKTAAKIIPAIKRAIKK